MNEAAGHTTPALLPPVLDALFLSYAGVHPETACALKGDASERRLFRIRGGELVLIGVQGPNIAENIAFIAFARSFRAAGLRVPEIFAVSDDCSAYLEEDLGDVQFADWLRYRRSDGENTGEVIDMYALILDELLRFQVDAVNRLDYRLCYQTRAFDRVAMLADVRYFRDNLLYRLDSRPYDEAAFMREAAELVEMLDATPRDCFLYRDFQSRNIMLRDGEPWFIDFQSGRLGAPQYDVASLLFDSRSTLTENQQAVLVDGYLRGLSRRCSVDARLFNYLFDGFAVLRLLQALGAFANLGLNKGKPHYLDFIPSRLENLASLLERSKLMQTLPYLRDTLLEIASDAKPLHFTSEERH